MSVGAGANIFSERERDGGKARKVKQAPPAVGAESERGLTEKKFGLSFCWAILELVAAASSSSSSYMERDFLGAIGRKEEEEEESETTACRAESDYPAAQWQFQAKAGAAPAFMSFRAGAGAREDSKEAALDQFSFSGFRQPPPAVPAGDSFDCIKKHHASSPVTMPHHQRQFGLDGQASSNLRQYAAAVHGHCAQGMDPYAVPGHHLQGGSRSFNHPMSFNPGNQMVRVQSLPTAAGSGVPFRNQYFTNNNAVASSKVGVYGGTRDLRNPKAPQMTIFYNGSVNVFDVPVDKARQLMVLASRASIPSPPTVSQRSDLPVSANVKVMVPKVSPARIIVQRPETSVPLVSGISSPITVVSQAVTLPRSTAIPNNDSSGPASAAVTSAVPPVAQASSSQPMPQANAAAEAIAPRAVPQARKASLARFLEKRKERVSIVAPYPSSKSPLESNDTLGSSSTPSKSSCTDIAPSSNNGEESMSIGLPRNISFGSEKFPSTKLQI